MFDPYDEITDLQWHAPFRVLITGSFTGGDGRVYYEAEEQIIETSDGSLIDDDEGGRVFANAAGSALLCEANDAAVTAPLYALARYRGDYEGTPLYEFDTPGGSLEMLGIATPALITGITRIQINETEGVKLTDLSGGYVRLGTYAASATQQGTVTTGSQEFAGDKTFLADVYLANANFVQWTYTPDDSHVRMYGAAAGDTIYHQIELQYGGGAAGYLQFIYDESDDEITVITIPAGGSGSDSIGFVSGGAGSAYFFVGSSAGATGTDAVGSAFVGGICTTVGTGLGLGSLSDPGADRILFWDESGNTLNWLEVGTGLLLSGTTLQASVGWSWDEDAQDAVGNILTDSSRINFTYSDPNPPTITADLIADTITAGYLHATAGDVLFGRDSGSGAGEEIAVGSGLTLSGATLSVAGTLPAWTKVTKHYSDFSAAATTEDIAIYSLPAGAVLHAVFAKTVVAFAGTGWIGLTLDIGKAGSPSAYIAGYNAFAAVSDTNFATPPSLAGLPKPEDFGSATSIRLKATSNGGNLNAGTAGEVDIWLWTSTLP